jgi:hypothetical protein
MISLRATLLLIALTAAPAVTPKAAAQNPEPPPGGPPAGLPAPPGGGGGAGMPPPGLGLPSGPPPGAAPSARASVSCFAADPAAASGDRAAHLAWGRGKDAAALQGALSARIDLLAGCSSLEPDAFSNAFADVSVIIPRYVTQARCFGGDRGVLERNRDAHLEFARGKTREQVTENLEWKTGAALECVDAAKRLDFFADVSVALAKASAS